MPAAAAMDCRNWDGDEYRKSILQQRETLCRTVFRTAFPLEPNSSLKFPELIVTACSDGSIASYSISSCLGFRFGDAISAQNLLVAEPNCLIQGHDGPAYDVKFYGQGDDSLLLSCGDDGRIRGWKWKEILDFQVPMQGGNVKPVFDLVNPQHKGPWGALSPIPENNAIAVHSQGGSVFAAAGDCCAYCWDLETCKIKMVFEGHSDYLHSIVARTSHSQIITGSEDGEVRIWDCKSGKCTHVIDPGKDNNLKDPCPYISCITLDESESWLVCGSGRSLSLWNLPALECVARITTNASIQDAVFDNNEILVVGAEALLSRFKMNGDTISQIQCAPPSAFSVSLHPSGVVAVAGYGALVDIISQFGSHLCTFRCKGP